LTTVQNADVIYVISEGKIVEFGTHQELIDLQGKYFALIKQQLQKDKKEIEDEGQEFD